MVDQINPISGLHDRTTADFRAMPPEQLQANKDRDESRRPVTAFELETGQRSNPFDHEKDPSHMPPARQPGKEPQTAFELEMMGGRKRELPLDAQESAASSPPETPDERILRLQKELELAEVSKMEHEKPGQSAPWEASASAEKASESSTPQAQLKQPSKPSKPGGDLKQPS